MSVTTPAIRTAVLLTHSHPEETRGALRRALDLAAETTCTVVVDTEEIEKHGTDVGELEAQDELPERPDLCLVLGGDGTILRALRLYAGTGVPVFAINFGTVGFLAAAEREDVDGALERAFAGDFEIVPLPGLRAGVDTRTPVAVNEAGREAVDVVLDGDPVGELATGEEMEVSFRDAVGSLAQLPGANFYRRLREKFGRLAH